MNIETLLAITMVYSTAAAQDCWQPYDLEAAGSWEDCWDAPMSYSTTDIHYGNNCIYYGGSAWLRFEVYEDFWPVSFNIVSDINYEPNPNGPEVFTAAMVVTECGDEVMFSNANCPSMIGAGYWLGGSLDDDYYLTLALPCGIYYMVIGNLGCVPCQAQLEGCLLVEYYNQHPLGLWVEEFDLRRDLRGWFGWNYLGQRVR